jgi:prophage regulatory protein
MIRSDARRARSIRAAHRPPREVCDAGSSALWSQGSQNRGGGGCAATVRRGGGDSDSTGSIAGQLLQERQWALQEIERLADEILKLRSLSAAKPPSAEVVSETEAARRAHALRNPNRLLRMKELRHLLGLGPSTIYKMMGEGRFPRCVHLGERATAWRLADIEAWQASLR